MTNYRDELPKEIQMRMDIMQGRPGIPFAQSKGASTSIRIPPPTRSPGVIGSGRPSASLSKPDASVGHDNIGSRWSPVGVIGNGRPESSAPLTGTSHFNHNTAVTNGHESMIPFSVIRTRTMKEESVKGVPGVIGRSKPDVGNGQGGKGAGQMHGQVALLEKMAALGVENTPQEPPRELSSISLEPRPRALNMSWPPSQNTVEFVPAHAHTLIDTTPLQADRTAYQSRSLSASFSAASDINKTGSATVSPQYPYPASPSASASEYRKVNGFFDNQPSPSLSASRREELPNNHINEKERDELSHAIVLLLSSRERVLTLTEQRVRIYYFAR